MEAGNHHRGDRAGRAFRRHGRAGGGRPVLGGKRAADSRGGASGEGGRRVGAARWRLQAALVAIRLPGARQAGVGTARARARRNGVGHRDGGHGRTWRRHGRRVRRLHPDRRPQHAELLAAATCGHTQEAGAAQARHGGHHQRSAAQCRVHPGRGESERDSLRARRAHLRQRDAQPVRSHGSAGGAEAVAPAHRGRSQPWHRPARQGHPHGACRRGGGRRRHSRGDAPHPRQGAERWGPVTLS